MKKLSNRRATGKALPIISALSFALSPMLYAQTVDDVEAEQESTPPKRKVVLPSPIEEVMVLGRIRSAAGDIALERMEQEVAVDLIDAELIARLGDSNVASALRRVPGVTLVDDKFVFVRGLGERNSSTSLNGAAVPSPDLTRNVVPLDIFPTSVVKSLSVQKMASADMPAAFGGGAIDIRTNGIPDGFVFSIEAGVGGNSEGGDFYTYNGGADDSLGKDDGTRALSSSIYSALSRYRGDFGNIAEIDGVSNEQASQTVRNLALELNRDLNVKEDDGKIDQSYEVTIGSVFDLPSGMEFGFLAGIAYDSSWRNSERTFIGSENKIDGTNIFVDQAFEKESTYNVSITGNFSAGLRLNEENLIETTSLFFRNTDDKTSIEDRFNNDAQITEGSSRRVYNLRFEERAMVVNQIHGQHEFGYETRQALNLDSQALDFLDGLEFNWYYSDSKATTDIPNEVTVSAGAGFIDPPFRPFTLRSSVATVRNNLTAADYRFTDLEDNLDSSGWELVLPISVGAFEIELSGGADYLEKARTYRQLQFGLGTNTQGSPTVGLPGDIFSDVNVSDPDNGFQITVAGENSDSYIASNKITAGFGKFDINWNDRWRLAGGVRWEDYQQVGLTWDPLDFNGSQIIPDDVEASAYEPVLGPNGEASNVLAEYFRSATFSEQDYYPSLAATFMSQDFFAEEFQLRFGFSETTVRPDLREITDSSYVDPLNDFLVFGDSALIPAKYQNYDLRAEWFFDSGDTLTATLFYKDITDPIDVQEVPRSEDDRALKIFNAESAEIIGLEFEFLKSLASFSEVLEPFFVQGNITVLDTNTVVGDRALNPTNDERALAFASDAVNLIFGFDSDNGEHAATISYNWFGERLQFAGRAGQADVFEQPSSTLDLTYSYFPTDQITVRFKAKNLLNEETSFERENADFTLQSEEQGVSYSLNATYRF